MQTVFAKKVAAAATAGAILLTSSAAFAAPVTSANATLEKVAPASKVDVYYRRGWGWRGPGPWIGAGIAAGVLAGAAIASRPYYYDPYYYGPAYPGPAYPVAPSDYYYYAPPPPQPAPPSPAYPRRCWIEGGVNQQSGYWTPC
jgi:hypothetical protein